MSIPVIRLPKNGANSSLLPTGTPKSATDLRTNWRPKATSAGRKCNGIPPSRRVSFDRLAGHLLSFQSPSAFSTGSQPITIRLCLHEAVNWQRLSCHSFLMDQHKLSAISQRSSLTIGDSAWQGFGWDFRCGTGKAAARRE
jgi:hypothetical protein